MITIPIIVNTSSYSISHGQVPCTWWEILIDGASQVAFRCIIQETVGSYVSVYLQASIDMGMKCVVAFLRIPNLLI